MKAQTKQTQEQMTPDSALQELKKETSVLLKRIH